MQDFAATEAALNFVVVAYNLMSLFKQAVLRTDKLHQLKTLRYKIFAIGGYITRSGNQKLLNLSLKNGSKEYGINHRILAGLLPQLKSLMTILGLTIYRHNTTSYATLNLRQVGFLLFRGTERGTERAANKVSLF